MGGPNQRIMPAVLLPLLLAACGDGTGPSGGPEVPGPTTLAVGGHHACRLLGDGRVFCWGRADAGQLGTGDTPISGTAAPIAASGVFFTSVVAGGLHACALADDGVPWCWGQNGAGQAGLPIATNQDCGEPVHGWRCVPTPHPVATTVRFRSLVAGASNTCGFSTDGQLFCWGSSGSGQLGAGAGQDCAGTRCSWTPVPIVGPKLQAIALGSTAHFCGLSPDGTAYCWGSNTSGELGIGTAGGSRDTPTPVTGGHQFSSIVVGGVHTCALDRDGQAWCWGGDVLPPGEGGVSLSAVPVRIQGAPPFARLFTGTWAACGHTPAGAVWCWGINAYGEMGVTPAGLNTRYDTPTEMEGHPKWQVVGEQAGTVCALDAAATTWCWGFGVFGELGPVFESSPIPVRIEGV